jgi:hypothetical protein
MTLTTAIVLIGSIATAAVVGAAYLVAAAIRHAEMLENEALAYGDYPALPNKYGTVTHHDSRNSVEG